MGERKVLNKYYPLDFDPAKIPRRRQPKNQQMKVRMMLPMSIRCGACSNYIYKGTKFNSRKEEVICETYLGIRIFRFYFKCTKCSAELTIKTDPQNSDYVVESGASQNFEPWRARDEEADKEKQKRETEEMGDAVKSLENRTLDSKREMDILVALDEVKSMRSRRATIRVDAMLEILQCLAMEKEKKLEEEDEALIKSLFEAGDDGMATFNEFTTKVNMVGDVNEVDMKISSPISEYTLTRAGAADNLLGSINCVEWKQQMENQFNALGNRFDTFAAAQNSLIQQFGEFRVDTERRDEVTSNCIDQIDHRVTQVYHHYFLPPPLPPDNDA
ncbi:unnamed protein product [Camellia sinensis]